MTDRLNKTSICSIVFLDIVDYSKKSVSEQFDDKALFNNLINEAIKNVAQNDRIILDTGDGAAITLMGEPEEALFVALTIRDGILAHNKTTELALLVRIGINLGSVRVVKDINDRLNIIGDGINVAQRIMSFAGENQILVSRSYYEVTSRLTKEITGMFVYSGIKHDKHVREHEVYSIKPNLAHQTFDEYDAFAPVNNSAPLAATMVAKLIATLENSVDKVKVLTRSTAQCMAAKAAVCKQRVQRIEWNALTLGLIAVAILLILIFAWLLIKPVDNHTDAAVSAPAPAATEQLNNEDTVVAVPKVDLPKVRADLPAYHSESAEKESAVKSKLAQEKATEKVTVKATAKPTTSSEKSAEKSSEKTVEKTTEKTIEKPVKKPKPKAKSIVVKEAEQLKEHEPVAPPAHHPVCSQAEIAMNQCRR